MTYPASTIAYWVGQANDTSTGIHPPGWSNGQRWSETAGEWQIQATDTSTGPHPPGWSNGQLWSETATEWMNDRNSVYDSRYTEGYNAGYAAADAAESPRALTYASASLSNWGNGSGNWQALTLGSHANTGGLTLLSGNAFIAPRTGIYIINIRASTDGIVGMRLGGGLAGFSLIAGYVSSHNQGGGSRGWMGHYWFGTVSQGASCPFDGYQQFTTPTVEADNLRVWFVPTPSNPQ